MIIVWIIVIPVVLFFVSAAVVGIYQAEAENKIQKESEIVAKLVQGSNLRSITKISQISGITESRTIKAITSAIERSSNEKSYFSDAYIDFDRMEIVFPKKKEDWTCVYCRAVNPPEILACQSCQASQKEL